MSVAGPVIEAEDGGEILVEAGHIGEGLIAAGGVFDQDHLQADAVQVEGLHPAEGGPDGRQAFDSLPGGQAQGPDGGHRGGGIVDIVDSGQGDHDLLRAGCRRLAFL